MCLYWVRSSRTGASLSDGLMSYPRYSEEKGSYPSAEMQSVYSTAPAGSAGWNLFQKSVNGEWGGTTNTFQVLFGHKRFKAICPSW